MPKADPFYDREKSKYGNPVPSREFVLSIVEKEQLITFEQLCKSLKVKGEEQRIAFKRRLRAMEREGQLLFDRRQRYSIPEAGQLVSGVVIGHRDGYGFLQTDEEGDDWFIPVGQMQSLFPGERVLAIQDGIGFKNKPEARIVRVQSELPIKLVGTIHFEHNMCIVVPEDNKVCQDIIIPQEETSEAQSGQVVVVEVFKRPSRRMNALGRVVEIVGDPMAPGMEIDVAIRNHDIPSEWPVVVEQQLQGLSSDVQETDKIDRIDLTHLPFVTIDGEDARDFDDAVYCETKRVLGGWRLWVAIADVSHYVGFNTPLDREAINRGNSVYFPERVVPMLPEVLSNGLCSLNPNVDRLSLVCEMTVSANGRLSGYKFYEATIKSQQRFTYTKVAALLEGDAQLSEEYADFLPHIANLYGMYTALVASRAERGAIEFDTVETRFVFNAHRKIEEIVPVVRNDAHKIIEECMILANISAAKLIEKHQAHALFRVHDKPDEEKLSNFRGFLGELGIETSLDLSPSPKDLTAIMHQFKARTESELIQVMLLRSMKQAVYQPDNIGHFGLALPSYAHFTSPIRRYPDLVVHRTIKHILQTQGQATHGAHAYLAEDVEQLGEQCSMTERRADDATREVSDWLKCEYMHHHIGDLFDGVISTVTNFGFFVRINDLFIDGLVHITTLNDDYYLFDANKSLLIGENNRSVFRMGDSVNIQVVAVNLEQRKIDFILSNMTPKKRKGARGKSGRIKAERSNTVSEKSNDTKHSSSIEPHKSKKASKRKPSTRKNKESASSKKKSDKRKKSKRSKSRSKSLK